jgi:hypothetical protein
MYLDIIFVIISESECIKLEGKDGDDFLPGPSSIISSSYNLGIGKE